MAVLKRRLLSNYISWINQTSEGEIKMTFEIDSLSMGDWIEIYEHLDGDLELSDTGKIHLKRLKQKAKT